MLEALFDIAKKAEKLDRNKVMKKVLSRKDLQLKMIEMNRNFQLFEEGIDANGRSLGVYSRRTIEIKREKGQPTNRVTLKDTGQFYMSFKFKNEATEAYITANTEKDDKDLAEVYGENILGLTDESLFYLRPEIVSDTRNVVRETLLP